MLLLGGQLYWHQSSGNNFQDAYLKLKQVLEAVNAVIGELFATDVMFKTDAKQVSQNESLDEKVKIEDEVYDWTTGE